MFKQEIDTNVFNITMATLKQGGELATGDPVFCKQCNAAFNVHSKIDEPMDMIGASKDEESKHEGTG